MSCLQLADVQVKRRRLAGTDQERCRLAVRRHPALAPDELPEVAAAAHALIAEAEKAGTYVLGGGVEESDESVRVWEDGSVFTEIYSDSGIKGGFTMLVVPTRQEAVELPRRTLTAAARAGRSAHAPRQS